jgi:NAD(P)-dependent dehydrogenase (short-subunit alcohol dehydrogenase family)
MTRRRTVAEPPVAGLLDLSGRVAIVTGASVGIGAGIAVRLAEVDAAVAVHWMQHCPSGGLVHEPHRLIEAKHSRP